MIGKIFKSERATREVLSYSECGRFVKCKVYFFESNKTFETWYFKNARQLKNQ
jgi:hypothetical protein